MKDLRTNKKFRRDDVKPGERFRMGPHSPWHTAIDDRKGPLAGIPAAASPHVSSAWALDWCYNHTIVEIEGRDERKTVKVEDMKPGRMYAAMLPNTSLGVVAFTVDSDGQNGTVVAVESGKSNIGRRWGLEKQNESPFVFARCFIDELAERPEDRIVLIDDAVDQKGY